MTQGYPLAMVSYGIVVFPPIKKMKAVYNDITQPCFADDADTLGMFDNVELYFH